MSDVALRFGATDVGLDAKFAKTAKQLKEFESSSNKVAASVSIGFGTLAKVVAGISLLKITGEAIQFADELTKLEARTGITTTALQNLQFVAGQTGASFDSITRAVNIFQRQLVEGGKASTDALKGLGISLEEINALSPDQQFERIARGISDVEDPARRTALAMGLFGKSGAGLLPILVQTGEQMADLRNRFTELGGPVSAATITKVDELGDSFDAVKGAVQGLSVEVLGLLSGPLTAAFNSLGTFAGALRFMVRGGSDEITNLSDQINKLNGRAAFFANDFSDTGQRKFRELTREAERLTIQLQALTGLGQFGVSPILEKIDLEPLDVQAIRIPVEYVPTQQDLRIQSQLEGSDALQDLGLQLVELNQATLDEMLRQDTEAMASRIQIASDGARFMADIRETFGLQEISFEQAKTSSIIDIAGGLFGALARENSKVAKVQQALAVAETVWSTSASVMAAMKLPFPTNFAVAGKIALMGATNIAKIKSTNYGSGSGSIASGGGSTGGSPASASQAVNAQPEGLPQQGVVQVIMYGDMYGFDEFGDKVVRAIQENVNDKDVVIINPASRQALELAPIPT